MMIGYYTVVWDPKDLSWRERALEREKAATEEK